MLSMGDLLDSGMTLGGYLQTTIPVEARCNKCAFQQSVNIAALAEKCGESYQLWDRRSRCKKPGCEGWVRFFGARGGVFLPLWSDKAAARWMRRDRLTEARQPKT